MRITFYYDDMPNGGRRLLCLDNPVLACGYLTYLRKSMKSESQAHVRVLVETIGAAGDTIHADTMTLDEYERRVNDGT